MIVRRLFALGLAAAIVAIVAACGSSHDHGFGEGCTRDDDCSDGFSCQSVSTTAFTACSGGHVARFCSAPCKKHDDCDMQGLVSPTGAVNACVTSCSGVGTCSWVGPK